MPPSNTLLVVNELIKANKDFDLLLLPNRGHGFGDELYMVRPRTMGLFRQVFARRRAAARVSIISHASAEMTPALKP